MNTFLELIHSRHSFRGEYQAVPVKREDLIKIMQAGIDAPSGCNKQTTSFIAIDDPHILKQLLNVIDPPIGQSAPAAICVLTQLSMHIVINVLPYRIIQQRLKICY